MNKVKSLFKKHYKSALTLTLGNFLVAFSMSFCFLNYKSQDGKFNGLLSGGLSGFTLILSNLFHIDEKNLELIASITTWVLFIIGSLFLGKKFALQTLYSTAILPAFLFLFKIKYISDISNSFNELDPLVNAIIGGLIMGVGCGIIYRIGGSTGGFDIPPLITSKYTKMKLSRIFLIQDGILVALAIFARYDLNNVIIGLISVLACSMAVEYTQIKGYRSFIAEIISDEYEEISKQIHLQLERGTTIINCIGGYTDTPRKMIKVMITKNQYHELLSIVQNIDKNAFMSLQESNDIFGYGFRDYGRK